MRPSDGPNSTVTVTLTPTTLFPPAQLASTVSRLTLLNVLSLLPPSFSMPTILSLLILTTTFLSTVLCPWLSMALHLAHPARLKMIMPCPKSTLLLVLILQATTTMTTILQCPLPCNLRLQWGSVWGERYLDMPRHLRRRTLMVVFR